MVERKDIEVEMTFLRPDERGRQAPCFSGYRPQFHYDGGDWSAVHQYIDVKAVHPGDKVRAHLTFLRPQQHQGKIFPKMEFQIREGSRTIAVGLVIKVLDLEQSA